MKLVLRLLLIAIAQVSAIEIRIDYTYDTQGFFEQPGSKEALRAVADHFEVMLADQLTAIIPEGVNEWDPGFFHPATGNYVTPPELHNMVVPENTLVVFVGGRVFSGPAIGSGGPGGFSLRATASWAENLKYRGQAGASATPARDFGPWGGAMSFDSGEQWNFTTNGRPANNRSDFTAIAIHEMTHLLGFGTCDSFDDYILDTGTSYLFAGPASREVWGVDVPLHGDGGHWREDGQCQSPLGYNPANPNNVLSLSFHGFGKPHGVPQIAIMDPSACTIVSATSLQVLTDLDLAGLRDVGWEVEPPAKLDEATVASTTSTFTWPTTSGISYSLRRSTNLMSWTDLSGPSPGDGTSKSFVDPNPPPGRAFYQLVANPPSQGAPLTRAHAPSAGSVLSENFVPRVANGCGHCPCCN